MLLLTIVALSGTTVFAQTKIEGIIKARSGAKVISQTADSPNVVVRQHRRVQVQGAFRARKKEMSIST